jgi:predicted branched-subunit amino acid permease
VAWPLGAVIGALIGSVVRDTNAFGLDAMFPAVILALVLPKLRDRGTLRAALAGAVVALATTPFLPSGAPVLLALVAVAVALPKGKLPKGKLAEREVVTHEGQ